MRTSGRSTVFGVALRVTTDRRAAEDVTQDVLLELWRRPERFDPEWGRAAALAGHHRPPRSVVGAGGTVRDGPSEN